MNTHGRGNAGRRVPPAERRAGARVRARRRLRGETIDDVARRARLDRSHVARYERGDGSTSVARWERLGRAVGVGLGALFAPPSRRDRLFERLAARKAARP